LSETLDQWIDRQYRYAAAAMQPSISATDIVKSRPGFGQTVRPVRGSVVASPVLAAYDPDPDYFFHWYRDSAVVMDALRLLFEDGVVGDGATAQLGDFVRFSLSLHKLDGRALIAESGWRAKVASGFVQYLRDDSELASVRGDAVAAETRVNPDGTLDISRWARPQHDGPPLRALTLMRWSHALPADAALQRDLAALVRADLSFTLRHGHESCYDIWEEESGQHYYTLRVSAAALEAGASWLQARGASDDVQAHRAAAAALLQTLDGFWRAEAGYFRSRMLSSEARSTKELDIAVILAAIHAHGQGNAHSVRDSRMQATLARLEALFESAYPINHNRAAGTGPAMGRYAGDVYYSGGAYFFSTLGAAEFCFRAAGGARDSRAWIERGDAYLATVRSYALPAGDLSEQFDQRTGAQTSARHLAWSYAAFISCVAARRAVSMASHKS